MERTGVVVEGGGDVCGGMVVEGGGGICAGVVVERGGGHHWCYDMLTLSITFQPSD